MVSKIELERVFRKHGFADFAGSTREDRGLPLDPDEVPLRLRRIRPDGLLPAERPAGRRMPRLLPGVRRGAVFHFEKRLARPEDRFAWTRRLNLKLLKLEREVFLAGQEKAFLLFMDSCNICPECAGTREACLKAAARRPTPEALAVDVSPRSGPSAIRSMSCPAPTSR